MRIFLAIYVFAIVATVSILGFRGSLSTKPPLEVFPDMDRHSRHKPQAENGCFADGPNDRPVPAGTVARGNYFNQVEVFSEDFVDERLGDTVFNEGKLADGTFVEKIPLAVSHELMERGREQFNIFCVACHGSAGDGNGVAKAVPSASAGKVAAADYHVDRLRNETDGYIFNVIMNGKGLMFPLNDRISPEEAWSIVLYVRALQRSQNASVEELTAAQRTELGF